MKRSYWLLTIQREGNFSTQIKWYDGNLTTY